MLINAHRLDVRATEASIFTMREALDEREDQLDRVVRDHAWSNEAVEAIEVRQDRAWGEARLGSYLHETYPYDWTFVIAPDGSTFFGAHEGDPVADDITKALGTDQWRPLVERSRGVAEPEPQAVHAFLPMHDGLGIGSVAAIMPETSWTRNRPAGKSYVLVVVRSLTPNWFSEFATVLGLSDLTFSLSTAPPETGLRLEGPDGKPVGSASWQARRPGTEYVVALIPRHRGC
jgi:sensor domain CHASE-containing protein